MKICSKCKINKKEKEYYHSSYFTPGHRVCILCILKTHRKTYNSKKEKARNKLRADKFKIYHDNNRKRYPEKYKAREITRRAVKSGKIIKKCCKICKNINTEIHHPDYTKPLNVIWLCRKHHLALHRKLLNNR